MPKNLSFLLGKKIVIRFAQQFLALLPDQLAKSII